MLLFSGDSCKNQMKNNIKKEKKRSEVQRRKRKRKEKEKKEHDAGVSDSLRGKRGPILLKPVMLDWRALS